jgi:hypothetical protein
MQFIANRLKSSSRLALGSMPSNTFLVTRITSNKIEISTGKLRTAIKMLLLLAFEAMPDIRLSAAENPKDANNNVSKNVFLSSTGLSIKIENMKYPIVVSARHNNVL